MLGSLQKLKIVGFKKVGEWRLEKRQELSFNLNDDAEKSKNVRYSFVSQNKVLYVGKTVKKLGQRLRGYISPDESQKTNTRCGANIKSLLMKKKQVLIYAFIRPLKKHRGFLLSWAAGLEDSIIKILQPEWNKQGKEKRK
jgi:hypothetical protein